METTISLPILDDAGVRVLNREDLEVRRLPGNYVRLRHSPAYVSGLARGDTIRLDARQPCGFRIVKSGGMFGAAIGFLSVQQRRDAEAAVQRAAEEFGAICDGADGRALVFSIPRVLGLACIRIFFNDMCERFPGAQWYLLNPDDPDEPAAASMRVGVRRGT
jgi:Domain of unknown function (DUF4265)